MQAQIRLRIIPPTTCWDGILSLLRVYSIEELLQRLNHRNQKKNW